MLQFKAIPKFLQDYLGPPDVRVKNWPLLNSYPILISLCIMYLLLVFSGPKLMKNRKPFALKNSLIVYNVFQVLFSTYICKEVFWTAYLSDYKFPCANLDTSYSLLALRMARAFWLFYVSKTVDVLDTVFLVLRKKESQLTFLHVYHHFFMLVNWYVAVLYLPGGQAFFTVGVNSLVHVVMYTYYLLSTIKINKEKYLWWKKYLTQLQLIQFFCMIFHIGFGFMCGCTDPFWLTWYTLFYVWTLVFLFLKFYYFAYEKKKVIPSPTKTHKHRL